MPRDLTSLLSATEAWARTLESYQLDPSRLFISAGLDPQPYRDPDARMNLNHAQHLWSEAVRLTGNPCIGFEVGMAVNVTHFHAVGYAFLASRTVREALDRFVRYQRMLTTAVSLSMEDCDSETTLFLDYDHRWPQEPVDGSCTAVITLVREITYDDFAPRRIEMTRPAPPSNGRLKRFFGCPIDYGGDRNGIVFRREQIEKFLPRQNPAMAQASDEVAARYIGQMERADVLTRARVALISMLPDGEPSRVHLAERMHMSERTLGRRLSDRDTSFRAVLDDVRHELAVGYIRQLEFSITEVTYLLGFSDQSNFARSFRRWTGHSPTAYRANQAQQSD